MINHSGTTKTLQNVYQEHLHRRQGLALAKAIIRLMIDLQKHRGCSLAILSGDHFFETQLYSIQRDITTQLEDIERLRKRYLERAEFSHVLQEWLCIRRQWTNDSPEENFLLHSNLISEVLKLIWRVIQRAGLLGQSATQDKLVELCFSEWLKIIETTAQARGLSTHCAVLHSNPPEIKSRLKFLEKQLIELDDRFQDCLEHDAMQPSQALTQSQQRLEYRKHLQRFVAALNADFIYTDYPKLDADTIYTYGSHAVSAYQSILFSALKLLDQQLSPELENWISTGAIGETASLSQLSAAKPYTKPNTGPYNQRPQKSDPIEDSAYASGPLSALASK